MKTKRRRRKRGKMKMRKQRRKGMTMRNEKKKREEERKKETRITREKRRCGKDKREEEKKERRKKKGGKKDTEMSVTKIDTASVEDWSEDDIDIEMEECTEGEEEWIPVVKKKELSIERSKGKKEEESKKSEGPKRGIGIVNNEVREITNERRKEEEEKREEKEREERKEEGTRIQETKEEEKKENNRKEGQGKWQGRRTTEERREKGQYPYRKGGNRAETKGRGKETGRRTETEEKKEPGQITTYIYEDYPKNMMTGEDKNDLTRIMGNEALKQGLEIKVRRHGLKNGGMIIIHEGSTLKDMMDELINKGLNIRGMKIMKGGEDILNRQHEVSVRINNPKVTNEELLELREGGRSNRVASKGDAINAI